MKLKSGRKLAAALGLARRFVADTIDFRVYQALSTIQGGEVINDDF